MEESEEILCKKCKQPFDLPFGKTFRNCVTCRETLTLERRAKPKYDPNTHRICRTCKAVKGIQSDFTQRVEKRSNICAECREVPKLEKEEKVLDANKVLSSVARTLEKLMIFEEVNDVMAFILNRLHQGEGEVVPEDDGEDEEIE